MPRPHRRDSIEVLESLYDGDQNDPATVAAIAAELKHRSTERARRLAARIESDKRTRQQGLPLHGGSTGMLHPSSSGPVPAQLPRAAPEPAVAPPSVPPPTGADQPAFSHPSPVSASQPPPSADDPQTRDALLALESANDFSDNAAKNLPGAILSAWIALEVLAPLSYKDPAKLAGDDKSCVARIDSGTLPWERRETSRPKRKLFYLVVLGELDMDAAMTDLLRQFGEDEEMPKRQGNRAPIAMAIVDKDGLLVGEESVAISSFAWGVPVVLRGKMGALARWPDAESMLRAKLYQRLSRFDADGKALPLDLKTIHACHVWLQNTLGLRQDHVIEPSFVARLYQFFKLKAPPEMPLLNSFFLGDLAKARQMVDAGSPPETLKRYLGMSKPAPSSDLLQDKPKIAELVAPSRFPLARWPTVVATRW